MIDCAKEQNLDLSNVTAHSAFPDFLTNSCEKESTTYQTWKCTPNKNTICSDIETKWKDLKNFFKCASDNKVKVQLMCFEKRDLKTKAGKNVKHLKVISMPENMFISERITSSFHHQN